MGAILEPLIEGIKESLILEKRTKLRLSTSKGVFS